MKKNLEHAVFILFLLSVLGIAIWFFMGTDETVTPGHSLANVPLPQDGVISKAFATASPEANAVIEKSFAAAGAAPGTILPPSAPHRTGIAQPLEVTNMEPFAVLENARTAIHNYGQRFGENPVGNNEEITRALLGENPKQVNFIPADAGLRVNGKGELTDAWGTPFFFHQMSGHETEIRSAGPDKIFYTLDDLLTR